MLKEFLIFIIAITLIVLGGFVPNTEFLWATYKEVYFACLFVSMCIYILLGFRKTTK